MLRAPLARLVPRARLPLARLVPRARAMSNLAGSTASRSRTVLGVGVGMTVGAVSFSVVAWPLADLVGGPLLPDSGPRWRCPTPPVRHLLGLGGRVP